MHFSMHTFIIQIIFYDHSKMLIIKYISFFTRYLQKYPEVFSYSSYLK